MENYIVHFTNVQNVIETLATGFKANPLARLDMATEVLPLWNKEFPMNDADEHEMTEEQLCGFMQKLHAINVDRLLWEMSKKNLIEPCWDSTTNDFSFRLTPDKKS